MTFQAVSWEDSPGKFIDDTIYELKKLEGKSIIFVSGGVDSDTCATLGHLAMGDRLHSIHFEHGGMRKGECQHIVELLNGAGIPTEFKDYTDKFMPGVIAAGPDNEAKRKVIKYKFFDAAVEEAKKDNAKNFLQGTNAADENEVIKKFVKTQNNVVTPDVRERFEKEGIKIVEPVKELYKDEIRQVARHLGLPVELTERQPFLGPGLYCRVIGQVTEEKMRIMKEVDYTASEKLERLASQLKEFADKDKQCFAALLENSLTEDGLEKLPSKIDDVPIKYPRLTVSKVTGLNKDGKRAYGRMLLFDSYDIEIEDLVNVSDKILGTDVAKQNGIVRCATFIDRYAKGNLIVPLRAVATTKYDVATALPILRSGLEEISDELTDMPEISGVVYDITHKKNNRATIEFE